MPGGRASHKGTSDKPNVNSNNAIGEAADKTLDPKEVLREDVTTGANRTEEFVDYPPALQRPSDQSNTENEGE